MSSKQEELQSVQPARRGTRAWVYFFGTIIVLFVITLTLSIIAHIRTPSEELVKAEKLRIHKLISQYSEETLEISFPNTEAQIEWEIDKAFAPVYENIGTFADTHYSVTGEYTELAYAAIGQLEQRIEKILFEGLDERLDIAMSQISRGFLNELADNIRKDYERNSQNAPEEVEPQNRAAMELAIDDTFQRFEASGLALKGSVLLGGGAAGVMITKVISASIAKKLLTVTAAKTAGKTATKFTGTVTAGAAGAGIGSVVPGLGTAAGGIIGGVIGWFTVDKLVVEVDEYLNREEFEEELVIQIDEQKALVKAQIRKNIETTTSEVKNKTPMELIRGGG